MTTRPPKLRTIGWTIHRWIGVGLCVLLVPIAISGALLVWKDNLDALVHPARYAVTGAEIAQPLSAYITNAGAAAGAKARPLALRFPEAAGWPLTVLARESGGEGRARLLTAYLDPASGRVLDTVDFRSSLVGYLHRFHENLKVPEWSGRSIIGWGGVGMLILSLSGIWLWWPRNGAFLPGLRWRRAPATTTNLHHLLGFWISLPLALVSLTGIYLSFPQTARSALGSILEMGPRQNPVFGAQLADNPRLTPEQALDAARGVRADARPAALFLPTRARGGEGEAVTWRVQLRVPGESGLITMLVDDRSTSVRKAPDPLAGDRVAQWIRWLHEGSNSGLLWRIVVFLTGVFPPIFAVTGVTMWLRGRRQRRTIAAPAEAGLQAAE